MDGERALVQQALTGDREAFSSLVKAYQVPVYNLAYRMLGTSMEAEEATQETFLRIYRRLHTYNAQQKLSSWILAIASHYCVDRLRRRRITWLPLEDEPALAASETADTSPERGYLQQEREQEMQSLLACLPEGYRLVLVLRYWHDLSYEEMARVLSTTESAVKSKLHRAREMLATHMTQRQPEAVGSRLERSMAGHAVS
jgi:RNA polymerase sigma-70 factor (ECF subfamily)